MKHLVYLVCILATVGGQLASGQPADAKAEPAFPKPLNWWHQKLKIASEWVDEGAGTQTLDEYHDPSVAKSAYYLSPSGHQSSSPSYQIRLVDGPDGLSYLYKPYTCQVKRLNDLQLIDATTQEAAWRMANVPASWTSKDVRVFGVLALWLFADAAPSGRTFRRAQIVYSASRDLYRESLMWQVRDELRKLDIKLYFIEHSQQEEPSLEMIQIEWAAGEDGKKMTQTINILSVEFELQPQVYVDLFEPPVGFGCYSSAPLDEDPQMAELIAHRRSGYSALDWHDRSIHLELEVTATRFNYLEPMGEPARLERHSESYTVEVAHSRLESHDAIELIRRRNGHEDTKLVINHLLRVFYTLDMRRGSCVIAHLADEKLYETVVLNFDNVKLQLEVTTRLFKDPDDMHFVKRTPASATQPEMYYFEGTGELADGRRVRLIFTYLASLIDSTGSQNSDLVQEPEKLDLSSVTIWLLDSQQQNRLLESYQLNLIDSNELSPGWPGEAKVFDISDECYLENEHMLEGRDYAWTQLTYPVESHLLSQFIANELELKQLWYDRAVDDFARTPRIEVTFEDDAFVIRTLWLDLPAIELMYDRMARKALVAANELGDLSYLAPDLAHCAHHCRLHLCTVMSFCTNSASCILSSRGASFDYEQAALVKPEETMFSYKSDDTCDTYTIPAGIAKSQVLRRARLHDLIARWQHLNYAGSVRLPKMPDELALGRQETGLSDQEYLLAVHNYQAQVATYLEHDNRAPELTLASLIGGHFQVLVPSKFELETDPLRDFNLYDSTYEQAEGEDDLQAPRFHAGLAMSRYNPNTPTKRDQDTQEIVQFRSYSGLSYDQCALACADSKCGSFSYCSNSQQHECVLSSVNSTGRARTLGIVQRDVDCFIAQRDFLANFERYENVFRPQVYVRIASGVSDASECALACVGESNFRCLAFEFCAAAPGAATPTPRGSGQCFFQSERHLPSTAGTSMGPTNGNGPVKTGCDHYSRSLLADFVRLESRKVDDVLLDKLKTNSYTGLSVFDCADKCAHQQLDCSGFQFCHKFQATISAGSSRQARQCTTIESKVTAELLRETYAGTGNGTTTQDTQEIQVNEVGGEIVQKSPAATTKWLQFDADCQLFTMRRDSSEAHLRDLAFGGLVRTTSELNAGSAEDSGTSGGALSFLGGLLLYLLIATISAALGCAAILLKDNNTLVRQKYDRLRIWLRL